MVAERRPYVSEAEIVVRLQSAKESALKFRQLGKNAHISGNKGAIRSNTEKLLNRLAQGIEYPGQWFTLMEGFETKTKAIHRSSGLKHKFIPGTKAHTPVYSFPQGSTLDDWQFAIDVNENDLNLWDVLAKFEIAEK